MAERRMFAKTIIDSDAFIDMPVTARLLYYDLSMRADDDGFVNAPKKIMRMIGASQDDLSVLILRKFIIPFESGVVVIRHWKIHNYIQKDRYRATTYQAEMAQLNIEDNTYTLSGKSTVSNMDTECIQTVSDMDTQDRLGKDRLGKDRLGKIDAPSATAAPPTSTEKPSKEQRHKYGEYENVLLSDQDYTQLKTEYPADYKERIERLSEYMASTGKTYKNHLATIRGWARRHKPLAGGKVEEHQTPASYDLERAEQRAKTSVPVLTKRERR